MNTTAEPTPAPRKRRWPYVLLALALLAIVFLALAPSMLSGVIAATIVDGFNAERRGKLEVQSLDLAWLSRQKLDGARLLDDKGQEVARVSVELPSLLDLARGGGSVIGAIDVRASADLIADDDGSTNLERALQSTEEKTVEPRGSSKSSENLGERLRKLDLELNVVIERLSWSDARTRAAGKPFVIEQLSTSVRAKPGDPIRIVSGGTFDGPESGKIALSAAVFDLLDAQGLDPAARFELEATLDAIPTALIDALAQQAGLVEAAFGAEMRVTASGAGTLDSGNLELAITGERGSVQFAGTLVSGVLTGSKKEALVVGLRPEREALARFCAATAPEGIVCEPTSEPNVDIVLEELRVDVASIVAALNAKANVIVAAVGGSQFDLRVSTNGWRATGASVPVEGGVSLETPRFDVRLVPNDALRELRVQVDGTLGGGASGSVSMQARCDDFARLAGGGFASLVQSTKGDEPQFDATIMVQQLGVDVLQAFVPAEVPVSELLGKTIETRIDIGNRGGQREALVSVKSTTLAVDISAWLSDGSIVSPTARDWTIRLEAPSAALARTMGAYLPEGTTVEPGKTMLITIGGGLRLPLKELQDSGNVAATMLRRAQLDAAFSLDRLSIRNDASAAKNEALEVTDLSVKAHVGAAKDAAPLELVARMKFESSDVVLRMKCPQSEALENLADPLELPEVEVELDAPGVPLKKLDTFLASDGALLKLGDSAGVTMRARATQSAQHTLDVNVNAELALAATKTTLKADARIEDPFQRRAPRPSGALPEIAAKFELAGLRVVEGFLSPELAANVLELLGESVKGSLTNQPVAGSKGFANTKLSASLDAARLKFGFDGSIENGTLQSGGSPLELVVQPSPGMIDRSLGAKLPEGATLKFQDAAPRFTVRANKIVLPLDAWFVAEGASAKTLSDVLRRAAAEVQVELPDLTYTQPPTGVSGTAVPVELNGLGLDAKLAAGQPASANLRGKIAGAKAADLRMRVGISDVGALVDEAPDAALPPMDIDGDMQAIPTALVDALAAMDGLLVDTLGAEMNLKLKGTYPSGAEPLRAEMTSPTTSLTLVARFEANSLEAKGKEGLDAKLPLTPLFSERIVGQLVPLLVHASKPEGAAPVSLQASSFSLPLDNDLRKLDAVVRLDLGEIDYELLPGLGDKLDAVGLGKLGRQTMKLDPLSIPIVAGVAGYDALPVSIKGVKYLFKGKYDLVTKELNLGGDVPLSLLGKSVVKELDKVRDYIDPNVLVPIEIKGTWKSPKISVGKKFVEDLLENAAGKALEGGLLDLFGKKKDKKKD